VTFSPCPHGAPPHTMGQACLVNDAPPVIPEWPSLQLTQAPHGHHNRQSTISNRMGCDALTRVVVLHYIRRTYTGDL
jgi:hypothetical protein